MIINFSNDPVLLGNKPSIFLAGPTRRKSSFSLSWRKEACELLEALGYEGIVYVPEFEKSIQFDYNRQVIWEQTALQNADIILFWVPRDIKDNMPGFTTNVEFGMYLAKSPNKVYLAYPKSADNMIYLDWLYTHETSRIAKHDLCEALLNILNVLKDKTNNYKEK